jgi:hypothetical protein
VSVLHPGLHHAVAARDPVPLPQAPTDADPDCGSTSAPTAELAAAGRQGPSGSARTWKGDVLTLRVPLKVATCGLATLLFVILAAAPAAAHAPTVTTNFSSASVCTIGTSQIAFDHTSKQASAMAKAEARVTGAYSCDTIDVFAPGYLAVRLELWRWTGSSWAVCTAGGTGWTYNSNWGYTVSVSRSYGTAYPCGSGYYGTMAYTYVWNGSSWNGGSIWSGYHQIPV